MLRFSHLLLLLVFCSKAMWRLSATMLRQSKLLVSPDVVVLENGRRNDGWADFRDNHLIPEFKEPTVPSNWEYRESGGQFRIGLGLYQTVIKAIGKNTQICYLSGLVRVRPSQGRAAWKLVLLDWSIRPPMMSAGSKNNKETLTF